MWMEGVLIKTTVVLVCFEISLGERILRDISNLHFVSLLPLDHWVQFA